MGTTETAATTGASSVKTTSPDRSPNDQVAGTSRHEVPPLSSRATTAGSSAPTVVVRSSGNNVVSVPYDPSREALRQENLRGNGLLPQRPVRTDSRR